MKILNSLALILGEMESMGVKVDVERLKRMGEELKAKLKEYEEKSMTSPVSRLTSIHQNSSASFCLKTRPAASKETKRAIPLQLMCLRSSQTNMISSHTFCNTDKSANSNRLILKGC